MTPLDLRSFNLFGGLMCTTMGVVFLAMRLHFRAPTRGLGSWGLAPLLAVASALLFALEGRHPTVLVSLAGNGLLLVCNVAMLAGSSQFLGRPWTWWPWLTAVVLCLLGLQVFLWIWPDYRVRIMLFALTMSVVCATHARLLWAHGEGLPARLMGAAMVWQTLVLWVRAVATWWIDRPDTHRFDPVSLIHTVYMGSYAFSVLLVLVGGLLMFSDHLRQRFEDLANHDDLTGALNRRAIGQRVEQAQAQWLQQGQGYALLLLDLDHFKRINDAHGHQAGDRALVRVVAALQQGLRSEDSLGRYGGEEFLVLMPGADLAMAQQRADQLRQTLASQAAEAGSLGCTVSVGGAVVQASDARSDRVVARADSALYQAKAAGRNRVVMG
ncbi:GGDEF domain-containing protein [Curvibacter sp. HBC28]|uniref:diguanylate cyclase n=1 Tax=Curvibacter microcysteis TaxID=3026419 RepID=A0ABT5MCT4_9BURK|nr:GGDEF domain-containing protein [Curvibacter sp. HBC28]MDD0814378.1 GGDEF domain-containing protein [Curvibacter sp. HBC28]